MGRLRLLERPHTDARGADEDGHGERGAARRPQYLRHRPVAPASARVLAARALHRCAAKLAAGGPHEAFVVGLNAPPGCGKSTLVQLLRLLLRAAAEAEGVDSLRVVHVSSDDLYMSKAQRAAAGVESRLEVESIDASLADSVLWALKRSTDASRVLIPRFNKGLDEREPEALWSVAEGAWTSCCTRDGAWALTTRSTAASTRRSTAWSASRRTSKPSARGSSNRRGATP